jgi:hypothetical protein
MRDSPRWRRRASTLLEAAMWMPVLVALLVGMIELARVSYTYYTVQKVLYSLARYLGTQHGVNYCDPANEAMAAAKEFALRGGADESAGRIVPNLEPDMIEVRIERRNSETGELEQCECSATGCDAGAGGLSPEWLVVSLPDGYPMQLAIPGLTPDPIPLRPVIRVPYGGI